MDTQLVNCGTVELSACMLLESGMKTPTHGNLDTYTFTSKRINLYRNNVNYMFRKNYLRDLQGA